MQRRYNDLPDSVRELIDLRLRGGHSPAQVARSHSVEPRDLYAVRRRMERDGRTEIDRT